MSTPTFKGTSEQQALAAEIFGLMASQGAMFAADAPIKQTLANLADFYASQRSADRDAMAREIDTALQENAQIFARHEDEDQVTYVTSRLGGHQQTRDDTSHSFKERLYEPEEPLPVDDISVVVSTSRPALTTVEPVFISDYWQQQAGLIPMPPSEDEEDMVSDDVAVTPAPPAAEAVEVSREPVVEAEPTEEVPADIPMSVESSVVDDEPVAATAEDVPVVVDAPEAVIEETIVAPPPADAALGEEGAPAEDEIAAPTPVVEVPPAMEVAPSIEDDVAETAPVEEVAEAVIPDEPVEEVSPAPVKEVEPEPAAPVAPAAFDGPMIFTLPDGTEVDLAIPAAEVMQAHGQALQGILLDKFDQDPLQRVVRFGRTLYTETDKVNLGKNDLRRIRDYIVEVGEPLLDTAIIADLYYHSPRQSANESFRFSLNYRLSREKDFEFVGVEGANLWSTRGLPAIGTKRVKASEIGQMTAYLSDGYDDGLEEQSAASIAETGTASHLLTFFEWQYGILPLDARLTALLPEPLLPNQRSVVLRFESPQHYINYLVEVRYPTGNRGGWIQGLEEFFHEYLVAGGLISISRTDEVNVFTITYEEMASADDRLLILDEKKNKFAFSNLSYFCAVDADQLLNQKKFGKLKNLKSLPMGERRKADVVLAHAFEVAGEQVGTRTEPQYWITLDDLYVAYNVLRPAARPFIETLLAEDDAYVADESTPGSYYYKPEPQPEEDDEEDEEDVLLQGQYDDDEDYS